MINLDDLKILSKFFMIFLFYILWWFITIKLFLNF